nr:MAG: hypothetical protein [Caudoviricetes sp.]
MIEAKIILDSVSPLGVRLTTFELKYPRFILSEFNTHRVFSRNSASSRAIPVKKMIKDVISDPVIPSFWGKNQAGMQAKEELSGIKLKLSQGLWRFARYPACLAAYSFTKLGLHKQIANRIIEPWMWTKTIVTATEWDNFFELRFHEDAQPEIYVLASKMLEQYSNSIPSPINYGEWHLPYITELEFVKYTNQELIKISGARCARVSYLTHDGKTPSPEKDFKLYDDLVGSVPIHASPVEHQATPNQNRKFEKNFRGWHQHRVDIEHNFNKGE